VSVETSLLETQITDHAVIDIVIRSINTYMEDRKEVSKDKKMEIINQEKLKECIQNTDWSWLSDLESGGDKNVIQKEVNQYYKKMFDILRDCHKRAAKTVTIREKKNDKKRHPWVTAELAALCRKKSQCYKDWNVDRSNTSAHEKYKLLSTKVKNEARKAKTSYYSNLLKENFSDPKKYWEIINKIRCKNRVQEISEIMVNGELVGIEGNEKLIAEEFNAYFNGVPEKLLWESGHKCEEGIDPVEERIEDVDQPEWKLEGLTLTESDVEKAIASLKNKKSIGIDGIPSNLVKSIPKTFSRVFIPLFNLSLATGIFPESFKKSIITPVYKNGDRKLTQNYRPISLIITFSKIFEKCIKEKLLNFLEHTNFLSSKQFGFTRGESTDTALYKHIFEITESIERKNVAVSLYLDLSKAFDTVNHNRLLSKLKTAGVKGHLLGMV